MWRLDTSIRRAASTIRFRMLLDGMSALVYLLTGKKACFKAVWEAHREFRAMGRKPQEEQVREYASTHRTIAIPALYPGWIVSESLLRGDGIFEHLRKRI